MQAFETRVIERRKKLQLNILADAEAELEIMKREKEIAERDESLETLFYTHGKAAMMSAKFYHECICCDIQCVLDVHTQYGEVDAIVEVKNSFIIIEFKRFKTEAYKRETESQLKRYARHHYPVVLIYDESSYSSFLHKLKRKSLSNEIYVYENSRFKRFKLSTKSVGN